jgi:hypothetical protein
MPFVRFATARALFESYPEVETKIGVAPTDHPPIDFAKGLLSNGKLADAMTFCAYLLPRREAVWWACTSVRTLHPEILREDADGLRAASALSRSNEHIGSIMSVRLEQPPVPDLKPTGMHEVSCMAPTSRELARA